MSSMYVSRCNRDKTMTVIFIGMKHCGKSTHGRAFAAAEGWDFIDTDDVLVDMYNRRNHSRMSVREIFNAIGEDGFRALEEEVMDMLLQLEGNRVVSMGGRMPVNEAIIQKMPQLGLAVFLEVPVEVLFERVKRRGLPLFIDPTRPLESFTELYQQREPYYRRCAGLTIKINDMPREKAAAIIFQRIRETINHAG